MAIGDQSRNSPRILLTVSALLTYPWVVYTRYRNRSTTRSSDDRVVRPAREHHDNLFSEDYNQNLFSKDYNQNLFSEDYNENLFSEDYAQS